MKLLVLQGPSELSDPPPPLHELKYVYTNHANTVGRRSRGPWSTVCSTTLISRFWKALPASLVDFQCMCTS